MRDGSLRTLNILCADTDVVLTNLPPSKGPTRVLGSESSICIMAVYSDQSHSRHRFVSVGKKKRLTKLEIRMCLRACAVVPRSLQFE